MDTRRAGTTWSFRSALRASPSSVTRASSAARKQTHFRVHGRPYDQRDRLVREWGGRGHAAGLCPGGTDGDRHVRNGGYSRPRCIHPALHRPGDGLGHVRDDQHRAIERCSATWATANCTRTCDREWRLQCSGTKQTSSDFVTRTIVQPDRRRTLPGTVCQPYLDW